MTMNNKLEFGDFQTPVKLAHKICLLLRRIGISPTSIVEPTCGTGNFLRVAIEVLSDSKNFLGFELNPKYVQITKQIERAKISQVNFFSHNWSEIFNKLGENILVVGNPP